jgi:glycosyltransferase involved in cell wall biosynthesis
MKEVINKILKKYGFEIKRYSPNQKDSVVSLIPDSTPKGNVLLSYIIDAFLLQPGQPISISHTNHWTSLQMAETFLDFGFCVDAISYKNGTFVPQKDYAFFIDVRWNLERLAPLLNKDCITIMHIDLCHMLYNNMAESRRLLELQQRKGVTLRPRRFEYPNLAIENADYATILGNEFTTSTFSYANKPMYRLPNAHPFLYPWPEGKYFEACRKNFLWFGSSGFVRKGLDLVLDVFAEMPEYNLTVCGPIQKEKDFEKAYYKELYQTPNINTIGWVNISSPEFIKITDKCIGLIFPSCAEGQCGGVINCLHAGLIPIISYESGVDVDDFGIILKDCSIRTIKNTVRMASNLHADKLQQMARKAWENARANHTRQKFAEEYRKAIEKIKDNHA